QAHGYNGDPRRCQLGRLPAARDGARLDSDRHGGVDHDRCDLLGRSHSPNDAFAPTASLSVTMPKVEYTAMLLGATGNVGGRILRLAGPSPLWKKAGGVGPRPRAAAA